MLAFLQVFQPGSASSSRRLEQQQQEEQQQEQEQQQHVVRCKRVAMPLSALQLQALAKPVHSAWAIAVHPSTGISSRSLGQEQQQLQQVVTRKRVATPLTALQLQALAEPVNKARAITVHSSTGSSSRRLGQQQEQQQQHVVRRKRVAQPLSALQLQALAEPVNKAWGIAVDPSTPASSKDVQTGVQCDCGRQHYRLLVLATALSAEGRTCYVCRKRENRSDKHMSDLQLSMHNLLDNHAQFKGWVTVHESTTLLPGWKARVDATIVAPCKMHIQVDGHEHLTDASKMMRDASSHCAALLQCNMLVRVHPSQLFNENVADVAPAVASVVAWRKDNAGVGAVFLSCICHEKYIAFHRQAIFKGCGSCRMGKWDSWVILTL
jgi:hypothetical protein